MELLKVGTEIYNHGDMANAPHFGTIIAVDSKSNFPAQYKIRISNGDYERMEGQRRQEYWVMAMGFSREYKGNGSTRLVTKEAYKAYRDEQVNKLNLYLASKGYGKANQHTTPTPAAYPGRLEEGYERFDVEYLKHSLFAPVERITSVVDKPDLIDLLCNGLVSVMSVKRRMETK